MIKKRIRDWRDVAANKFMVLVPAGLREKPKDWFHLGPICHQRIWLVYWWSESMWGRMEGWLGKRSKERCPETERLRWRQKYTQIKWQRHRDMETRGVRERIRKTERDRDTERKGGNDKNTKWIAVFSALNIYEFLRRTAPWKDGSLT